jgi:hypothetical protein
MLFSELPKLARRSWWGRTDGLRHSEGRHLLRQLAGCGRQVAAQGHDCEDEERSAEAGRRLGSQGRAPAFRSGAVAGSKRRRALDRPRELVRPGVRECPAPVPPLAVHTGRAPHHWALRGQARRRCHPRAARVLAPGQAARRLRRTERQQPACGRLGHLYQGQEGREVARAQPHMRRREAPRSPPRLRLSPAAGGRTGAGHRPGRVRPGGGLRLRARHLRRATPG